MNLLACLISSVFLLFFPLILGRIVLCVLYKDGKGIARSYAVGTFFVWAVFELVSVPLIILRFSFTALVIILSVVFLALVVWGIIRYKKALLYQWQKKTDGWPSIVMFVLMMIVFGLVICNVISHQSIDDDDARFVVNAIDMILTDKIFLTNPATGYSIPKWTGELIRDVASPWAAYQAYISKLAGIYPTVFMHSIQPIFLFLCALCVQWELSGQLVGKKIAARCAFCILLWVLIYYAEFNGWTAEGYLLERIWQGKSVVASIGITYIILLLFELFDENKAGILFELGIVNAGMCLLSNMGVLFGIALVGVFGLIYGLIRKNWKWMIFTWLTAAPNVAFGVLSKLL